MNVKVITTLHEDGYNLYGKEYLLTWLKHFPKDWSIDYYAEDHTPNFESKINVLNFKNECNNWNDYYIAIKKEVELLDSSVDKKSINRLKKALRWSFKMFTLLHALKTSSSRYLIWLDSDVYATEPPKKDWIETCLNGKCIAGQHEFIKGALHIESGILIIDLHHKDKNKIIEWIEDGYVKRKILLESKPWDGFWLAKMFSSKTVECNAVKMLHLDSRSKMTKNNTGCWLIHNVGDNKFNNLYNGRSGRKENTELI